MFGDAKIYVVVKSDFSFKRIWFDKAVTWWMWDDWTTKVRELDSQQLLFCIQGQYEFVSNVLLSMRDYARNASCVSVVECGHSLHLN